MPKTSPPGSARSCPPLINWHTRESDARSAGCDAGRPPGSIVGKQQTAAGAKLDTPKQTGEMQAAFPQRSLPECTNQERRVNMS